MSFFCAMLLLKKTVGWMRVARNLLVSRGKARNDSFAFTDGVVAIGLEILQGFHFARRPTHFEGIDLCGGTESKMHAQIVLRKVAAAAVDLVRLGDAIGRQLELRVERQAVALCAGEFETH